jgi:hypothetical protein
LLYPQTVTLYQVDDQIISPAEVALVNKFNTFLDALDGVSLERLVRGGISWLTILSHTAHIEHSARLEMIHLLTPSILTPRPADSKVN